MPSVVCRDHCKIIHVLHVEASGLPAWRLVAKGLVRGWDKKSASRCRSAHLCFISMLQGPYEGLGVNLRIHMRGLRHCIMRLDVGQWELSSRTGSAGRYSTQEGSLARCEGPVMTRRCKGRKLCSIIRPRRATSQSSLLPRCTMMQWRTLLTLARRLQVRLPTRMICCQSWHCAALHFHRHTHLHIFGQ